MAIISVTVQLWI